MTADHAFRPTPCHVLVAVVVGALLAAAACAPAWGALVSEPLPPGLGYLTGVSCVGAHCVAVGGTPEPGASAGAMVSADGGKSWSLASVPAGFAGLYGVSCSSTANCWAVGELSGGGHLGGAIASRDGGRTWVSQSFPPGTATATSVGCVGSTCVTTGARIGSVLETRSGGAQWSSRPLFPPCKTGLCLAGSANAVTLVTATVGYAGGGDQCGGHVTRCPGYIWKTSDAGASWRMVFNGFPFVDAISCIDASHCWAAAATFSTGVMLGSANGGRTWRRQSLPSFGGFFNGISCRLVARHHHCVAVGQNEKGTAPVIAQTNDGGSIWRIVTPPAGTGPLGGVAVGAAGGAQIVGENPAASSALALGP